jgi:hypothetical protein
MGMDSSGDTFTLTQPAAEMVYLLTWAANGSGVAKRSTDPVLLQYNTSMAIGDNDERLLFASGFGHEGTGSTSFACTDQMWARNAAFGSWSTWIASSHGHHALLSQDRDDGIGWALCRNDLPEIIGGELGSLTGIFHGPAVVNGFDVHVDGRYLLYSDSQVIIAK